MGARTSGDLAPLNPPSPAGPFQARRQRAPRFRSWPGHGRMTIERPKVNIPDELAGRTLVGQPRLRSIKRGPRVSRGPAVPDGHKLFSLNGIPPKLALAPFFFGPQRCGPLARHPALIEAHGPKSPGRPQSMTGRHAPTTLSFRPLFSTKSRPIMLNLSIRVDDPSLP